MSNEIHEAAFPAGEESDESDDAWEIGGSEKRTHAPPSTTLPEDKVAVFKGAITAGDVQLVENLLNSGMDVEARFGFGWTPLMCAANAAHFELAQVLCDRGASANFSKDQYTVLMAACTAPAPEEKIAKCVELLLSRNADPNVSNNSHMTPLMFAARDGHKHVITLLVSHGAELNSQDRNGYTALMYAVQYGREGAVLKLIELGAGITTKTKEGMMAADIAKMYSHSQISAILASPQNQSGKPEPLSKEETLFKFFKRDPEPTPDPSESCCKYVGDMELLLHGLKLEHLTETMLENDISWSNLLVMEKEDLEKIGITNPEDQKTVLTAIKDMQLDKVELDQFTELGNFDHSSEELYNFLISLRQQCSYLTETVQDVINKLPRSACELVLDWDPKMQSQSICDELVEQIGDLHKEATCLSNLLNKMNQRDDPCRVPSTAACADQNRRVLKIAGGLFGIGLLFFYALKKA
ncbi:ankyrin repeat, SAM and basic leucine zipper domain-containing protein 1 [Acipenser ruthenus]|uniref:ankyrin repeat, SAM and basic leucine zipper domain-containing protein 1 n=1 Tax=Acipenser ruthenus TaxID=7906 RepID=UPI0027412A63|nr:ankyrin repeat, SAM and basic leucine zipper domain-containing protein 1 [Acipenser ruthenus]